MADSRKCFSLVWAAVLAGVAALSGATGALAQSWPSKPLRVVVAFPAGGSADVLTRILAPKLAESLGQAVVVENRPGATGTIGTAVVAKATPDGYTLTSGASTTLTVAPALYTNLPYDALTELQPITRMAQVPNLLLVNLSVPANNVRELVELAKAQPGKLTFASGGAGSTQHLAGELFKLMTGISMVHVPYKGGAPAMADLIGGQVSILFEPMNSGIAQVRGGKVRNLAISTPARIASMPDLPTIAETLPGYETSLWFGLLGPAGMPRDIVNRLHAETVKILRAPDVRERFAALGADPIADSVEAFAETMRSDTLRWADFVRKTGMKLE